MKEETKEEVITYLLGEVKRLTTELSDTKKRLNECSADYTYMLHEYTAMENKYNELKRKTSNDPCFSSVINSI